MSDTIQILRSEWDALQARADGLAEELRRARAELDAWAAERAAGAQTVDAWRVSEARYRSLIETQSDLIVRSDVDGRLTFVNDAYCRTFGRSREELLGQVFTAALLPEDAPVTLAAQQVLLSRPHRTQVENRHLTPQGVRWFSWDESAILDEHGRILELQGVGRDITERKQAEAALAEERNLLRTLIDALPDHIYVKDRDGRTLLANVAQARALGLNGPDELIGKADAEFPYSPDALEAIRRNDLDAMAAEQALAFEEAYTPPTGETRSFTTTKAALRDLQGAVIGVVGISHDITAWRQAQEALRRSEEKFAAAFHGSPAIMTISLVRTGQFIEVNAAFLRRGGYQRDEVIGHTAGELGLWADPAVLEQANRTVSTVGRYHDLETVLRTRSGEELIGLLSAEMIEFAGERCILTVAEDVTARKQMEEQVRQERDRAEQYLNTAEVLLMVLDAHGAITLMNRKGHRILDYADGELLGKNWMDTCLPARVREETQAVFRRLIAGEADGLQHHENPVVTARGEERLIAWHNTLLKDSTGRIVGILSSGEDITERRQAEEALRRSEEKFAAAFHGSPAMMTIALLRTGQFVDVNAAFERRRGFRRDEVIGRTAGELGLWADAAALDQANRTLHAVGRYHDLEAVLRTRSGEEFIALLSAETIEFAGERRILTVAEDITARKRAEEALRVSQQKSAFLAEVIERSSQPFAVGTADGRMPVSNAAFAHLTGYTTEELSSLTWDRELTPPEWCAAERAKLEELDRTGQPVRYEKEYIRKDGSRVPVELLVHLVTDEQGQPVHYYAFVSDITERKQAEAALEHARERLELALHGADLGMYDLNLQTNEGFADHRYLEMIGYTPGEIELSIDAWVARIHPDDVSSALPSFKDPLDGPAGAGEAEYRVRHKSGHWVWILDRGRVVSRDEQGHPVRLIGTHQDITARKRAEEELRQSRERLELALHGADLGMYDWNPQTGEAFVDARYLEMVGYAPGEIEVTTESWATLTHPDDLAAKQSMLQTLVQGQLASGESESRVRHKSGHWVWVLDRSRVVSRDARGRPTRIIGTHLDITARKRAEEQVRYQAGLVAGVSDAIIGTDLDFNVVSWNAAAAALYGWTAAEAIGRPLGELVPTEYQAGTGADAAQRLSQDGLWRGEVVQSRRDGSKVPILAAVSLLRDAEGRPTGAVGVNRDLTARRQLEEQLRQAQKMKAVGTLAGGVAHDFNNLLTVISGNAALLFGELSREDPRRQEVAAIQSAADRAAALTRQLLAFSRRQVLQPKVLNLNDVLAEETKMLRRLIGEDVILTTDLAPDLGRIKVDPGHIEQVILNLVVNAREAMPHGGRLLIETANADLDQAYADRHADVVPGPYVLLALSDSGVGMDPETLGRIFEPFFSTKEMGTGLGLATVYGIVAQSGGHIRAYSEPGQGATFRVYLPRVAEEVSRAPRADVEESLMGGAETVLWVEDEEMVRRMAARCLRELGYRVLEAAGGEEALALAAEHAGGIQLLMTDVVMPGLRGPELARQLQAAYPHLHVLYVSGYTAGFFGAGESPLPAARVLEKPFTLESLAAAVRQALDEDPGPPSTPAG